MLQNYNYRARNSTNHIVTGVVQAPTTEDARKILSQNKLTPISVTEPKSFKDYIPFFGKIGLKDVSVFARQLATMIDAGLTLTQALRLMVRQTNGSKMRQVMEALLNDLQDGFSFSTALSKFPEVFNNVFINVVRSGEATGKLENVLLQLAANLEKDVKVRGKITGALFYPSFILVAMVGVAIVMLVSVIPTLTSVFESSGSKLPASTTFLVNLSHFFVHQWYLVIVGALVLIVGGRYFLRTEFGVRFFSKYSLKLPVAGLIIQQSSMARFARLLGMLLSSGVPLLESLRMINDSFTNRMYKNALTQVALDVERGIPMSAPIGENPLFPLLVGQMVSVGEQTGKMDEVMTRMADYYESEVDSKVSGISSLIEPLVIVVLGVGVAWLVIAILLPIYQISSNP